MPHTADFLHISATDLHPAMLGCSTDARLLLCAILGEEYWIRVKYYKYTVLPPPPTNTLFSKLPNTIMALFNFLHVMMDGPQKEPLLYPILDVGRFTNNGDVHKNANKSACSAQYVCLVLNKTDTVRQFLIRSVKEFKINHMNVKNRK